MDLPIRRRDHERRPEQESARLRDVPGLPDALHDVLPLVDVEETDDSYALEVELPGVRHEDVDLEVGSGRLRLTAERRERERIGLLGHRTRTTGRYSMAVTLPGPVDDDAVTASLDHGLLTVVIPKAERARRRRIPIGHRR